MPLFPEKSPSPRRCLTTTINPEAQMSVWPTCKMRGVGRAPTIASSQRNRCLHAGPSSITSPSLTQHGEMTSSFNKVGPRYERWRTHLDQGPGQCTNTLFTLLDQTELSLAGHLPYSSCWNCDVKDNVKRKYQSQHVYGSGWPYYVNRAISWIYFIFLIELHISVSPSPNGSHFCSSVMDLSLVCKH